MIEFALPWAVLVFPALLLLRLAMPEAPGNVVALRVPALDDFRTSRRAGARWFQSLLFLLAWAALVAALCQPQRIGGALALPQTGRDLVMAMDISGSMEERDFVWQGKRMSRIAAVREVASEFATRRVGDRVGLIVFAERAYVQVPLTFDLDCSCVFQ